MFKRSTKLTALLVTAASLVSVVPAAAADRLGSKDGTINRGFAYEDGKYVFDGYKTDDDDEAIYFNNGSKDEEVDDYDDYDMDEDKPIYYGTKYVVVDDDDDKYLLDLSTGKIDDDETVEDKFDNAKSKLYTNLKKADRYSETKRLGDKDKGVIGFQQILEGKRGEVWYQYTALGDKTTNSAIAFTKKGSAESMVGEKSTYVTTSEAVKCDDGVIYTGFANETGNKYVDITHDANIYALVKSGKNSSKLKTVKLDEYEKENGGVTAKFLGTEAIAQDKDNIYTITTVQLTYNEGYAPEGIGVTDNKSVQKFLQKISKSQGTKEDDAYTPKNTTSYQLDTKVLFDDGDVNDATKVILNEEGEYDIVNFEAKDSTLYATGIKEGNAKVWVIKLKKAKVDSMATAGGIKTDNVDSYVAIKDDDFDQDIVGDNLEESKKAYCIDIDGNTWVLDKGKLYKSTGSDFKEMYTCDRALDRLDVYNDNNLIIWEGNDGEVYTNVSEGKKQTEEDAGVDGDKKDEPSVEVKAGWNQTADGNWTFYDATGVQVKSKWVNQGGYWYYLNADGTMATGWLLEGGNWYYLNPVSDGFRGAMKTGWQQVNGVWYYLNASGAMKTGWFQDSDGRWYFLKSSGAMAVNEYIDGYYLGANGAWVR